MFANGTYHHPAYFNNVYHKYLTVEEVRFFSKEVPNENNLLFLQLMI